MMKYFGKNFGFSSIWIALLCISSVSCSSDDKADYDKSYFVGDWDVEVSYFRITDGSGQRESDTLLNAEYSTGIRFYSRGRDYGEGETIGGFFPGQRVEWSYNEINQKFLYSERLIGSRDLYEVWLMDVLSCEDDVFQVREIKEYYVGDTLVTQNFTQVYRRRL